MLIGLAGKKQHGKSTVAKHLIEKHEFIEVSWAYPLKEIIGKQLMGLTDDQVFGSLKEKTDHFWGKTPRELLQIIGTNCFRKQVHPDFWVKLGERKIKDFFFEDELARVVVSDCRFPNEIEMVKRLGGFTIRVVRTDFGGTDNHPSEIALDGYKDWTYQIHAPSGDIDGLTGRIDQIVEYEKDKHVRTDRTR